MHEWAKSRRLPVLALWSAAYIVVLTALASRAIPIPSLARGALANVPFSVFAPLIPAIALLALLGAVPTDQEFIAQRRPELLDAACSLALVIVLSAVACALARSSPESLRAARNLATYVGVGITLLVVVGPRVATTLLAVLVVAISSLGRATGSDVSWWALPLQPARDRFAFAIGLVLLLLGLITLSTRRVRLFATRRPGATNDDV
jgi:hypothetical protein